MIKKRIAIVGAGISGLGCAYALRQHPEFDIRFVFTSSKNKISKNSKTSYADWCDKNGFLYADKFIPEEWFN